MLGPDATFRDGQREAIEAVIGDGGRALVVQRTGWGKSLVYWIATRVRRDRGHGPTLIISPLLALMRNQIAMAGRLGPPRGDDQLGQPRRVGRRPPGPRRRRDRRPAHLAGAPRERALHDRHPAHDPGLDRPVRRRRGALHLRLGPRLPARLPAHRPDPQLLDPHVPVLATTATANDRVVADVADQLGGHVWSVRGRSRNGGRLTLFSESGPPPSVSSTSSRASCR